VLIKANIHSFLESDDRVNLVVKYLDEALGEVDAIDSLISSYKIHLNVSNIIITLAKLRQSAQAVGDDISFIQSQRRGLQVQMQNQGALLSELENLLVCGTSVVFKRVPILCISPANCSSQSGSFGYSYSRISRETHRRTPARSSSHRALQGTPSQSGYGSEFHYFLALRLLDLIWYTEMAATMERLDEYRTHNAQFCKRIFDYLSIMTIAQVNLWLSGCHYAGAHALRKSKLILEDSNGINRPKGRRRPVIANHQSMESYLGRYAGLLLYLKEMDEAVYSKFCAVSFLNRACNVKFMSSRHIFRQSATSTATK
jgi:hypothetical protein